jgi:hypothetical protein
VTDASTRRTAASPPGIQQRSGRWLLVRMSALSAESVAHTTASTCERQSPSANACRAVASNLPEAGVSARPGAIAEWSVTSHADRHGHDCPSAPAMQQPAGRPPPLATKAWTASTRAAASPAPPDCCIRRGAATLGSAADRRRRPAFVVIRASRRRRLHWLCSARISCMSGPSRRQRSHGRRIGRASRAEQVPRRRRQETCNAAAAGVGPG